MNKSIPRIKLNISGGMLRVLYAIARDFAHCGKIGAIGLTPNVKEEQNFKLNNKDFKCVYNVILQNINGPRYPNKSGKEYEALLELKKYFELECIKQRNHEIQNL